MRRISISQFRQNIHKEIEDLPIELIRHGKTVATVVKELDLTPEGIGISSGDMEIEVTKEGIEMPVLKKIEEDLEKKGIKEPFKMPHHFGGKK